MLGIVVPSYGQTATFSCPSGFTSSGACGAASNGQNFKLVISNSSSNLAGSQVDLIPSGTTHGASSLIYQTVVNEQAFSTAFTFVPNGQNVAFVLQNTNDTPGYEGANFIAGAGCEAGFYQASGSYPPPNNIFALELDSYSPLTANGSFTYSSAQIYQGNSPCTISGAPGWTYTPKYSTSPVPLNYPATSQETSTGDTYSATITYDGSNVVLNLYDKTAGGSCPGSSCFTYTWNNINIPSLVGGNTAYVGLTGATGLTSTYPLYVDSFSYTVQSPGQKPGTPTALVGSIK
jgi:hypothetical protein